MGREAERGRPLLALQLAFCTLALLLAAVGVFGFMRQPVDERRAEFEVRIARLFAQRIEDVYDPDG
jgi:hypothetical protein